MNRQEIIESYFSAWICQNRARFDEIFSDEVEYSECYGPEYHGLEQVQQWFDDWNQQGKVLTWNIKNFYQDRDMCIVEWYFECDYNHHIDGFDGVSLILFNNKNEIISIKEFQSKSVHYLPYM